MVRKISLLITVFSLSAFSLYSQIPNSGFENWSSAGSYSVPDSWGTMNHATSSYSIFTATRATPGNPGTAYLKLTSKTVGSSVVNGIAVCGKLDTLNLKPLSGFSYTLRPSALTGRYQHMIYGNSQGSIKVLTSRWNTQTAKRDTIAYGQEVLAGMAMSWANFNISLTYLDSLNYPDSCIIVLQASGANPANNDYLWVDNLALTGSVPVVTLPDPNPVGLSEKSFLSGIKLTPNPAQQYVKLTGIALEQGPVKLSISDVLGKVVYLSQEVQVTKSQEWLINISDIPAGLYILTVVDSEVQKESFLLSIY